MTKTKEYHQLKMPLFSKCKLCRRETKLVCCEDCMMSFIIPKTQECFDVHNLEGVKNELMRLREDIDEIKKIVLDLHKK